MIGCVFIGMSVDGFIARLDGDLTWLTSRGEAAGDAGFSAFLDSVDALLMGRVTYDLVAGFQSGWPYGETPVHVLSTRLPTDADPRITVHRSLDDAIAALDEAGAARVYLDGGRTVQTCFAAGLVDELTLSRVSVLIGEGVPLFGPVPADIDLEHVGTEILGGGMVQTTYTVSRTNSP